MAVGTQIARSIVSQEQANAFANCPLSPAVIPGKWKTKINMLTIIINYYDIINRVEYFRIFNLSDYMYEYCHKQPHSIESVFHSI